MPKAPVDVIAYDVRDNARQTLVRDPTGHPLYFWISEAPEMTDELVANSVKLGSLIPCSLGPSLASLRPSGRELSLPAAPAPPLLASSE